MDNTQTIGKVTKVLKGEKYPRTFSVEGNIVWMSQVTELKDGDHYFKFGMNMEHMDGDQVLKHAAKDVNIVVLRPRVFKIKTSAEVAQLPLIIDPMEYPAQRGGGIDKHEAAIRVLESLGFNRDQAELALRTPKEKVKELLAEFATQPDEPAEPEWIDDESSNKDDEQ
jgi:hypothetical protein